MSTPKVRVAWEGDSKERISSFPEAVKVDIGFALYQLQQGEIPKDIKSMSSLGAGVFEIRESDARAWYRVIYLAKIGDTVHVLHCFKKESAKTSKKDLETVSLRLARVRERLQKEKRNEKRKQS